MSAASHGDDGSGGDRSGGVDEIVGQLDGAPVEDLPHPPGDVVSGWRRLAALPLELLIRVYRLLVSPLLPSVCRFYPSCSSYGLTAVRRFGLLRGGWLTTRRLMRCHPWNPGGVDHVPQRGIDGRPVPDLERARQPTGGTSTAEP
ncbi:MAG TPA: membrane protein insertion efficiency factor YidD [Dermatophilaceae bacterium]|nr:membrane protein insertion efficiency factor YidD [Dermatophilaceae bacterium]